MLHNQLPSGARSMGSQNGELIPDQSERLARIIEQTGACCKLHRFPDPVNTSIRSSEAAGVALGDIIKTVVFHAGDKGLVAAIVAGDCTVDRKALRQLTGVKDLRLLSGEELMTRIGFPQGGVPPFGFDAQFYLDSILFERRCLFGGGGSIFSLIEIDGSEIVRVSGAARAEISRSAV